MKPDVQDNAVCLGSVCGAPLNIHTFLSPGRCYRESGVAHCVLGCLSQRLRFGTESCAYRILACNMI